jgi:UDP-glucose 4-epimerase
LTAAKSLHRGEIYNVGSGQTISVNRLVELLVGDVTYIPKRPGEPDCTFADIAKIRRDLNWQPQVNIEKGVEQVLANIDYWRSAPVWTPASIATATQDWFKYLGNDDK